MVGRGGLEPPMFLLSRIYSPLPSPLGYLPIYNIVTTPCPAFHLSGVGLDKQFTLSFQDTNLSVLDYS